MCQVLFAQEPAQLLEELGHEEGDYAGEERVAREQVDEEEDHHVEHRQGELEVNSIFNRLCSAIFRRTFKPKGNITVFRDFSPNPRGFFMFPF